LDFEQLGGVGSCCAANQRSGMQMEMATEIPMQMQMQMQHARPNPRPQAAVHLIMKHQSALTYDTLIHHFHREHYSPFWSNLDLLG